MMETFFRNEVSCCCHYLSRSASVKRGRKSTHYVLRSVTALPSPMRRLLLPPELIESPPFLPSSPLKSPDPKSCLQLSEFSHYVDNASGREGRRERVSARPVMTFGWFDKKCFEDSQLRKQERHRRAEQISRAIGHPILPVIFPQK